MNEEPKILRKKLPGLPGSFLGRLAIIVGVSFFISLAVVAVMGNGSWRNNWPLVVIGTVVGLLIGLICFFVRWIGRRGNFRRFIFGCFCLITLIALLYAEEDWRGKHAWDSFKREEEAKGERFDLASVIPPAVPDDQNFALTPLVFTSYGQILTRDGKTIPPDQRDPHFVNRLEMPITRSDDQTGLYNDLWENAEVTDLKPWQQYYRTLATTTNMFPVAPQPQTPAQDVLLALSKYDSTIEELRGAAQLPYSRFPIPYDQEDPLTILLPHLAVLKGCGRVLWLRAVAELQNGESEKALADIQLMLRVTDAIHTEPILISQLVRIALADISLAPIYEGLAERRWTDAQLKELDGELAKFDFLADYHTAMRGEMILLQGGALDYLRRHPRRFFSLVDGSEGNGPDSSAALMIPNGWIYQNQLNCARPMLELYRPAVDAQAFIVSPSKIEAANAALQATHVTPYNVMSRILLPALSGAAEKFARAQTSVNFAQVAIALERYRLQHGEFPELLDALTPAFMEQVPHDIIDGGPLHYRRTDDGLFVLYSIGWNETDDGGVVVMGKGKTPRVNFNQGDWVWRYPAK